MKRVVLKFALALIPFCAICAENTFPPDGTVRIGTSDPTSYAQLDVRSNTYPAALIWAKSYNSSLAQIWQNNLVLRQRFDDSNFGAGFGPGIGGEPFCGTSAGNNYYGAGAIKFLRENSTALDQATAIVFMTRSGSANSTIDTEKMRITAGGRIGIGTSSPNAGLHTQYSIADNYIARFVNSSSSGYGVYIRNGDDTKNALSINNAADSLSNHVFFGNGNAFLAINQGRLGVGTTSPATIAHFKGADAVAGAAQVTLEGAQNGYGAGIDFVSRTTQSGTPIASMAKITADGEGPWNGSASAGLRLFTANNGVVGEKVRIMGNGNVGIGTTSPQEKLHLEGGNIRITGSNQATNTSTGITTYWDNSYLTFKAGSSPTVFSEIGLRGNYNGVGNSGGFIDFKTAGTERLRITETGESRFRGRVVALNANAEATGNQPVADLHVQGTGDTTEFVLHSSRSAAQGPSESKISFKTGYWCSNGAQIAAVKDPSNDLVKIVFRTIDGQYNLQDRVTVGPAGNMIVQGTLSAQEVKVTASGFPDYVFDPTYKLKSLEDVAAHIKEHRRLPGIPSASEVEKDGMALSEMSKKQMEKIEEITLYLIQMRTELTLLKQENVELRNQLKMNKQKD